MCIETTMLRTSQQPIILVRFTAESGLKIAYGYTVEKEDDELIKIVDTAMDRFNFATAPGAFLADVFPIREYGTSHSRRSAFDQNRLLVINIPAWFPGAQWKRKAQAWRKDMETLCDVPFQYTKSQIVWLSFLSRALRRRSFTHPFP